MLENLKPAKKIEAPKDFRPALEFDGTEGYAITPGVPTGEVPNFEEFLEQQGFDSSLYEIVGSPRTSRWQKYDESWLTSYRFNFRLKQAESISDWAITYKNAKQNYKLDKRKLKESDKALVVMLADFQIGKLDHRGGHQEQLERIFKSYDSLEEKFKQGYSKIILADMGDIVEGFSNKADMSQAYSNTQSLMQQVDVSVALIWDIVKRAKRYCDHVVYATVASNHCQFRLNKQQVGLPGLDDWGVVIAQQINRLATETGLSVEVLIPQPSDESLAFDVFGDSFHVLGLWHGHQSARPEAVPSWWEKQTFGNQPVTAASIGLTGHFHHLRVQELGLHSNGGSRYWIQGKTMDNGSSWFRLNSGQDSQPGLTCFELEKNKHFTGSVFNV